MLCKLLKAFQKSKVFLRSKSLMEKFEFRTIVNLIQSKFFLPCYPIAWLENLFISSASNFIYCRRIEIDEKRSGSIFFVCGFIEKKSKSSVVVFSGFKVPSDWISSSRQKSSQQEFIIERLPDQCECREVDSSYIFFNENELRVN